ncbi:MAG: putative cation-transporting ATPase [Planctomycetota bacterium]|jgi:magnesium-transporting ATPase (P-type)
MLAHGMGTSWHAIPTADLGPSLHGDATRGLTSIEAAARLRRDGPNRITVRRGRPLWALALAQFHAPLVYILLVAGAVMMVLGDTVDAAVIWGVVVANAAIGFLQEARAVKAIDGLSRALHVESWVIRDGIRSRVDAERLVRGDLVALESGDRVPADLRLLEVRDLQVDESSLTGESEPVAKDPSPLLADAVLADRRNMAHAGSLVTRGQGQGMVVAAGDSTELGRISEMLAHATEIATPLTRKLAAFSGLLLWVILAVAALAFAVGVWRGQPSADTFKAAVALAVGAIPEGLPAAVTIMLAVGVSRMAARQAIIRKLPAVEALGSTTVICSDKTGTLTRNQMTVQQVLAGGEHFRIEGVGYAPVGGIVGADGSTIAESPPALRATLLCAAGCNDARLVTKPEGPSIEGDPTEGALLVAAAKGGVLDSIAAWPRRNAIPFEPDRQWMATLHERQGPAGGGFVILVKGSVERVLDLCGTDRVRCMGPDGMTREVEASSVLRMAEAMASEGLRVLAMAWSERADAPVTLEPEDVPQGLVLLGLAGMLDPPRPEAMASVAACHAAGVRVKMITGDHAHTAARIAQLMGIAGSPDQPPHVLTGASMATMTDEALTEAAETTDVFARMTPEQKLRLVRALQTRHHVVAMTGDGVNDAPALRQADIGVAMGRTGTEVAKDAADMVLANDNFASIEAAVEEGRSVFSNLTKFIGWTLPTNVGEAFLLLTAILMGWPLPFQPVQALYINMVTAVLLGMPLIFEPRDPAIMHHPPRDPRRPLLTVELFMRVGFVSLLFGIASMLLFDWQLRRGADLATAQTTVVCTIVIAEIFYLFPTRALLQPAWSVPLFANRWLWAGILSMLGLQWAAMELPWMQTLFRMVPLDAEGWMMATVAGVAVLVLVELEKGARRWVAARRGGGRDPFEA